MEEVAQEVAEEIIVSCDCSHLDYTEPLEEIFSLLETNVQQLNLVLELLTFLAGLVIFFVVVTLFKYAYKFFNDFF